MKNKDKAIIESTVVLPLSLLSINSIQEIKNSLTIIKPQSKSFAFTGKKQEEEAIAFYSVEGQNIRVPRKFGIELLRLHGIPFVDKRVEGDVLGLTFNEEAQAQKPDLKPTQDSVVRDVANGLLDKTGTNSGLLQAGTGTGKCISSNSLVFTEYGIVPIGSLLNPGQKKDSFVYKSFIVDSFNGSKKASGVFFGGRTKTKKVSLRFGYEIEGTPEHPVLTFDGKFIWKKLSDIKSGDYVVVKRGASLFGKQTQKFQYVKNKNCSSILKKIDVRKLKITRETAEVAGLVLAEGHFWNPNTIGFSNSDSDVIKLVNRWAQHFGVSWCKRWHSDIDYYLHSSMMRQFFMWTGFKREHSRHKTIPNRILCSGIDRVTAFLRGYFEGEAAVDPRRGTIEVSSASRELLRQVQVVLLGLGIISSFSPKWNKHYKRYYWRLTLYSGELKRYSDSIGFISSRKKALLVEALKQIFFTNRNPNFCTVPFVKNLLLSVKTEARTLGIYMWREDHDIFNTYIGNRNKSMSRDRLKMIAEKFKNCPSTNKIKEILSAPYEFLEVKNVRNSFSEVVDLTVPDSHAFVGNGIVCHNTLMGVKVACTVNRKTLVVINSEFLAEQWIDHFKRFTNIKDDEIGAIQQDQRDISGKKVVIGMIQTMVRRDFSKEEKKAFGLVIWDEAHRLPAPVFSQTLQKFDAKYLLGLSATPERWDGLDALLGHGLGGKLNSIVMGPQLVPDIYIVYNSSKLNPYHYKYAYGPNAGKINLCKLINLITGLIGRNQYISKLAIKAVEKDRKVMVFSDRKDQLRDVQARIEQTLPGSTALFIGGLKKAERDSAKFAKIMLCTYQFAAEALDVPERDCLILASPKSKVKQVMGRILRSQDGKRNPVVVDVVDNNVPILEVFASKRVREYKSIRGRIHLPNGQEIR